MNYVTVYDAGRWSAVRWGLLALFVALLLAGGIAAIMGPRLKLQGQVILAGGIGALFALLMVSVLTLVELGERADAASVLSRGGAQIAEGPVEMLHAMPAAGHDREHIRVGGRDFTFSDYETWQGFRRTTSHGGPLVNGVRARLSYVEGKDQPGPVILKVEVARPPSPAS